MAYPTSLLHRSRFAAALTAVAFAFAAGCGDGDDHDHDHDHDHVHEGLARVEIETRGMERMLRAIWTDDGGWTDGEGNPVTELPAIVDNEGALEPFTARGRRASVSVRMFEEDGDAVGFMTASRDENAGNERTCGEYEGRYTVVGNQTNVIAWPPQAHPMSQTGSRQFVDRPDGEGLAGIFHCDHIHIYPNEAGTVDLRFLLWHDDHDDGRTDPITLRVTAGS